MSITLQTVVDSQSILHLGISISSEEKRAEQKALSWPRIEQDQRGRQLVEVLDKWDDAEPAVDGSEQADAPD